MRGKAILFSPFSSTISYGDLKSRPLWKHTERLGRAGLEALFPYQDTCGDSCSKRECILPLLTTALTRSSLTLKRTLWSLLMFGHKVLQVLFCLLTYSVTYCQGKTFCYFFVLFSYCSPVVLNYMLQINTFWGTDHVSLNSEVYLTKTLGHMCRVISELRK